MTWLNLAPEHVYLLQAHTWSYAQVSNPQARASLAAAGLMEVGRVRNPFYPRGQWVSHAMVLTKAGRKRAEQIRQQLMTPRGRRYERAIRNHALQKTLPKGLLRFQTKTYLQPPQPGRE